MKLLKPLLLTTFCLGLGTQAMAQEPVVGVDDPESLFTDDDPQIHANKQVALLPEPTDN